MSPIDSVSRVLFYLLLIVLLFTASHGILHFQENVSSVAEALEDQGLVPITGKPEMAVVLNETRRKLNSFQICALCTCCVGKHLCAPSPCCYAINCNIPNRPFGFCSFTPKTCNCLGCHL